MKNYADCAGPLPAPAPAPTNEVQLTSPVAKAYLLLITGGICLGISPLIVKALPLSADVSAFYRVAFSAPLFLAFSLWQSRRTDNKGAADGGRRPPLWLYGLSAVLFVADLLTMHISIRLTNASVATLFTNCAPFFVGIFGILGLSDRPTKPFWSALPLALCGVVLIVGLSAFGDGSDLLGNMIALLAGLFYGGYLVVVRRLKQNGAQSSHIMVWVTAGSTLILAPLLLFQQQILPQTLQTVVLLAGLVLIGQVAGQGLVTAALRTLHVTSSSIVLLIQPVVAAPLAWLFLGETLSPMQILGMSLVLVSIALATRPMRPAAPAQTHL
ncbi:DMT family transporter [Roseibium litorale]|uniref:DMT family transporter n=1 Tax=Roseibium litorale TaxID=2803841 RepID=A0ABR9CLY0_9HYPH|nr:DMT family transporter [Roseibium litorale]MBD8891312.1 DMT family transporter [Roseibium litorale]